MARLCASTLPREVRKPSESLVLFPLAILVSLKSFKSFGNERTKLRYIEQQTLSRSEKVKKNFPTAPDSKSIN